MATYTDAILVYSNGYTQKIGAGDNLVIGGSFTATNVSGNGSGLTDLNAGNITTGTLADARLSSNVAKYNDAAPNFANTVTAAGFSGNGSALTSLNASNLSSGTVADARLSSNVPLKNAASNAFTGDMSIGGDLVVTGDIVSSGAVSLIIGDNFIDLNAGNTLTSPDTAGGLSVNIVALGTPFTGTDFVAGVAAVSNPYITVSADPTGDFAAGDLIQVSGSTDSKNDGQYVVLSVSASPDRITVKGTGVTGINTAITPFAHTQFVAQTGQTATVTKAQFSVIAASNGSMTDDASVAIPAGDWCWAKGSTETDFTDAWNTATDVVTLQAAYEGGSGISMNAIMGPLTIAPAIGVTVGFSITGSDDSVISAGAGNALSLVGEVGINGSLSVSSVVETDPGASAAAVAAGDLCYIDSAGTLQLSDGNAVSYAAREVDGVYNGNGTYLSTFSGAYTVVKYTGGAPVVGDTLYLSATAGQGTATVPTSGRVTRLGRCIGNGSGGLVPILWNPQYIADL